MPMVSTETKIINKCINQRKHYELDISSANSICQINIFASLIKSSLIKLQIRQDVCSRDLVEMFVVDLYLILMRECCRLLLVVTRRSRGARVASRRMSRVVQHAMCLQVPATSGYSRVRGFYTGRCILYNI